MPRFYERFYSLDLKKSASFGTTKEVYTLRCRLFSYGSVKDSRNFLLTPKSGRESANYTQWNSLNAILKNENVLIFSYHDLRPFFAADDLEDFIKQKTKTSLEIRQICELFLFAENITSLESLNSYLQIAQPASKDSFEPTPENLLDRLGRSICGFNRGLRSYVISLISATHPFLADWLDGLREKIGKLPSQLGEHFPSHFIRYDYEQGTEYDQKIDDRLGNIFSGEKLLGSILKDYEYRPEQLQMARIFAGAMENQEVFVAEAGTGTGKSLAYLIPAIYNVAESGQKAAVATYTKTLQSQLFFNDLASAAKACACKFSAALLKGRANYLCLLKKAILKSRLRTQLTPADYYDLARIEIWESLTQSGDLAEINLENPKLAREISAEANFCLKQSCQFYSKCYFFRARKFASRADLAIINQALFFSDMLAEGSLLGNRELLIFDEAHRLEKTASAHLGGELERFFTLSALNRLYLKRDEAQSILTLIEVLAESFSSPQEIIKTHIFDTARRLTTMARNIIGEIFEKLKDFQMEKGYMAETFPVKIRFRSGDELFSRISAELVEFLECLTELCAILVEMYSTLNSPDMSQDQKILAENLFRSAADLAGIKRSVDIFANCDSNRYVFWLEVSNRGFNILKFAPLDVGEDMDKMIYQRYSTILFTSASLSVEGYFDFFQRQIGLDRMPAGQIVCKSFGSSFDFYSQIEFLCPVYLASPKSEYYSSALAKFINLVLPSYNKKSLVLCTSNQLISDLYYQTARKLRSSGFEVFAQSISGTAEQILRDFKRCKLAVIFGTDSFWEGIDLPGNQLELLMITRLPFATPTEPVEAARMEQLEEKGVNSFMGYSLPNAVLKFKQGFGRLIRQKSDAGYIVVTDNRLVKSNFGQIFLNSVPAELNVLYNQEELMDRLNK